MNIRLYLIIAFIAATAAIGFFLVWPEYQQLMLLQPDIERAKTELQEGERYFAEIENLHKELDKYKVEISIIDTILPEKVYIPHLYDFFQKTCSRNGLIMDGISHSVGSLEGLETKEINLNLAVIGDYEDFRSFLSSLESSVRFFGVKSLSFSSPGEGESFSFNLTVNTFSR